MDSTQELFIALESGLSCAEIQTLIDNGSDICYQDPSSDEYPLIVALRKNLPLDTIKLLYHELIPSQHIVNIINLKRPSAKTRDYLILRMMEKPNTEFHFHIYENAWNPRMIEQTRGRAIRSTSHKSLD